MDVTSNEATLPPGFVRAAYNSNIGLSGGYVKRNGITERLLSAWTGKSIYAGIEMLVGGSTSREVVFGTDGEASGGELGYNNSGSITSILSGLNGVARPSFLQLGNRLAFFNGVDAPVLYDGTTTRQMGITMPAGTLTGVASNGAGALLHSANYLFAITYYNSVTGAESSPLFSDVIATGASDDTVSLSFAAGSSSTADTIRIYRTVGNGNQLFFEADVTIASTSYVSVLEDEALDFPLEEDNSRITDFVPTSGAHAQYPVVVQGRVFLKVDKNAVRFSKVGQSGPMFESFQVTAVADTQGTFGDGDEIVGLGAAGEIPIVLKNRSVGRLDAIGIPDTISPTDPVAYQFIQMSDTIGAVSHFAQCQVFGELVWLARDNIYATDGRSIRKVADSMSTFIKTCGFLSTQASYISAHNDTRNSRVYFAVFESGLATKANYILVGDYQKKDADGKPFFRWTLYRPGSNVVTHPGINAGCFYAVQSSTDGQYDVKCGNRDLNGQIYNMNDGDNDNDHGIYFVVKSRAYTGQQPLLSKLWKDVGFHTKGNGNSYSIEVSAIYDLSGIQEDPLSFSLEIAGDLWDTALWDESYWADLSTLLLEYSAHRKAKFQQIVWSQIDADAPVELIGWGTSGSLFKLF